MRGRIATAGEPASTAWPCTRTTGGRGLSTLLLDAAHERFLAVGGRRADAMALVENATGQAAWAAAGHHQVDHWRRWVKPRA